jgi:peptidoglycan/LPS O-acetylase OafA/YrhL
VVFGAVLLLMCLAATLFAAAVLFLLVEKPLSFPQPTKEMPELVVEEPVEVPVQHPTSSAFLGLRRHTFQ